MSDVGPPSSILENDDQEEWEHHYERLLTKQGTGHLAKSTEWQRDVRQIILKEQSITIPRPAILVEIGCGQALDLKSLAITNPDMLVGVDYASNACRLARRNLSTNSDSETVRADMRYLPFKEESLSLVFSSGVIEHLDDPSSAMREISRVLTRGGVVITFVPNKSSPWTLYRICRNLASKISSFVPPWPVKEIAFSQRDLRKIALQASLKEEKSLAINLLYLLEPLEIIVRRMQGLPWDRWVFQALWRLLIRLERVRVLVSLLGMEVCQVARKE